MRFFSAVLLGGLAWGQQSAPVPPATQAAPGTVELIPLTKPTAAASSARKDSYTVTVPGTGAWVDSGFAVGPGDHMAIAATGKLTLNDGRETGPEGAAKGWKDLLRQIPAPNANGGALIGRFGSSDAAVPFAVGAALDEDAPASGELFLAANTGSTLTATGEYKVTIKLSKASNVTTQAAPVDLKQLLPPTVLAGVPRRVTDAAHDEGDVVNFAIIGTEDQVKKAFTAAGWVQVDRSDSAAVLHGLISTLSKQSYTQVPMSTLYLFGRPQDMSYARADPLAVAFVRHHLRVWNSGQTIDGKPLWVGSATHDNGLERDQRNNGVTHHIDPNIDQERDFIEQSFAAAGALSAAAYDTPPDPVRDAKTATGGTFTSDGRVVVLLLRAQ